MKVRTIKRRCYGRRLRARHTPVAMAGLRFMRAFMGGAPAPSGQIAFDGPSSGSGSATTSWVVPAGVFSICVVCIGPGQRGGASLTYRNSIAVVPGETLEVLIWPRSASGANHYAYIRRAAPSLELLCLANAGNATTGGAAWTGAAAVGAVSYAGGNGQAVQRAGGGGAAGYAGNGGNGGGSTGSGSDAAASGGGGGGGGGGSVGGTGGGGGGVGLLGIGATGTGGVYPNTGPNAPNGNPGTAGSGGSDGNPAGTGNYGAGAFSVAMMGIGGVRIIWGAGRSFPSNAGDV